MRTRNLIGIAVAVVLILLAILLADRFSDEVDWSPGDFVIAGVLLFGAGLAYEFLTSRARLSRCRVVIGMAIGVLLLLIWAEIAVGLIERMFGGF